MGLNETNDGEFLCNVTRCLMTCFTDNPDTSKSPRGVRGFALDTGNFSEWRVQGKVGGYVK